jgi:hypothetical protein
MTTNSYSDRCRAILAEMESIPVIVPGKVSARRERGGKITGWKLQRWHGGRNQTQHIPAAILDRVREGTVGYQHFEALADEFAELRCREVLGQAASAESPKKKRMRP